MALTIENDIEARAKAERQLRAAGLAREELARLHRDEALAEAGEAPIGHGPERDATALKMEGVDVDKLIGAKGPSSEVQDKVLRAEARMTPDDVRMRAEEPQAAADLVSPSPIAAPPASDPGGIAITALLGTDLIPSKVPNDPQAKGTPAIRPAQETRASDVLTEVKTETNAERAAAQARNMKAADAPDEEKASANARRREQRAKAATVSPAKAAEREVAATKTASTPDVSAIVKDDKRK